MNNSTEGFKVTSIPPVNQTTTASNTIASTEDNDRLLIFQILLYIIDVAIIVGNSFVIWLVVRKKSLHTVTNMLLVSLAISDLMVGLAVIPSFVACFHVECDGVLAKMVYDYFLFVSVANLCAITVDRYTAVMHPLRYPNKMTPVAAIRVIAIAWVVPLILSILPISWTYSNTSQENQDLANKVFYTIQVLFFVFTPCCLMLWAYFKIFREAIKQARRIHSETGYVSESVNGGRTLSPSEARNAIKVFGTVVAFFVFCWSISAYRTFVIYFKLLETVDPDVTMASRVLLVGNSAVNPVFYSLWKKDVRREVERLFVGRRRNVTHPATSASNPSFVITQQAATLGN
jgi:hypothetical protein